MELERDTLMTLEDLFSRIGELQWPSDQLYIEGARESWMPSSGCAVIEVDPYKEEPSSVLVAGVQLVWALAGFDVIDVWENLRVRSGDGEASAKQLVADIQHFREFGSYPSAP